MKRFFALFLAALLSFSVPASAAPERLDQYYACFYDAYTYGQLLNKSLSFDTLFLELFFTTKDDTVYYSKKMWKSGQLDDTGVVSAVYAESGNNFTITMPDDTVFSGYWDPDNDAVWLDIGAGFFLLHRIKPLDIFTEWNK